MGKRLQQKGLNIPGSFKIYFRKVSFIVTTVFITGILLLYVLPDEKIEIEGKVISYGYTSNESGNHIKMTVELDTGRKITIDSPFNMDIKEGSKIILTEIKSKLGTKKYSFKRLKAENKNM